MNVFKLMNVIVDGGEWNLIRNENFRNCRNITGAIVVRVLLFDEDDDAGGRRRRFALLCKTMKQRFRDEAAAIASLVSSSLIMPKMLTLAAPACR